MNKKENNKPSYNEEDVEALEHVSMLINEYMCCNDDELTDSGKWLKQLVESFYYQWEIRVKTYELEESEKCEVNYEHEG